MRREQRRKKHQYLAASCVELFRQRGQIAPRTAAICLEAIEAHRGDIRHVARHVCGYLVGMQVCGSFATDAVVVVPADLEPEPQRIQ